MRECFEPQFEAMDRAELAQLQTTHAETARLAAQASARQLQAAQVRG